MLRVRDVEKLLGKMVRVAGMVKVQQDRAVSKKERWNPRILRVMNSISNELDQMRAELSPVSQRWSVGVYHSYSRWTYFQNGVMNIIVKKYPGSTLAPKYWKAFESAKKQLNFTRQDMANAKTDYYGKAAKGDFTDQLDHDLMRLEQVLKYGLELANKIREKGDLQYNRAGMWLDKYGTKQALRDLRAVLTVSQRIPGNLGIEMQGIIKTSMTDLRLAYKHYQRGNIARVRNYLREAAAGMVYARKKLKGWPH